MTTVQEAVGLPPKEAIAFLRQKTNQTTQRWTDVWNEAHSRAFSVAGAASEALVEDFRTAVAKAIEQGTTLAEFRRDFDSIVAKHGWVHTGTAGWRSQIIYETNLSTAYSAGRYAQMTEPDVLQAFPYWRYQHNAAIHPRQQHLDWSGLVLRADDPWWGTHYPPNGWRCHCSVSPVSRGGLGRMGRTAPDTAPPIDLRPVQIRTDDGFKTVQVPRGIDPSFAYNPGEAWLQHDNRPVVGELPARPGKPIVPAAVHVDPTPDVGPAPVQPPTPPAAPVSADLDAWLDGQIGRRRRDGTERIAGHLSPSVLSHLRQAGTPAASTSITITSRAVQHLLRPGKALAGKAIQVADLKRLPGLLAHPRAVLRNKQDGSLLYVFEPLHPVAGKLAMFAVRLDVEQKGLAGGVLTRLATAGLMPVAELRNRGNFDPVDGDV